MQHGYYLIVGFWLMLVLAGLAGCPGIGADETLLLGSFVPLEVISTEPAAGVSGVSRDVAVRITFNKEVDSSSLVNPESNTTTGAVLVKSAAGANIAGTVTYNASANAAMFVPTAHLSPNLTYTVTVRDVRDLNGQALLNPYIWTFTTGPEPDTIPVVVDTSPASEAIGVARDTAIQAVFSEPIGGVSTSTFVVRDMSTNAALGARSLVFDQGQLTATFRPLSLLTPNTTYTVTLQDIAGLAGYPLMGQYIWSFTTGNTPNTTPVVVSTTPAANATDVSRDTRIEAVFDSVVTGTSAATFLLRNSLTGVSVSASSVAFSNTSRTAVLVPSVYLAANTSYTATLRGLFGTDGVVMPEKSWQFTTGASPDALPLVIATTPASDAVGVGRDTAIQAVFSEPISGISAATFVVRDPLTNMVVGVRSLVFDPASLTATFRPLTLLSAHTTYTVTLQDILDSTGFPVMTQYIWSFTTGQAPNTTPEVVSKTPVDGAVNVPRNTRIRVVFNEAVTGAVATSSTPAGLVIRNTLTNALVAAEVIMYSNTDFTAVHVPSVFLAPTTNYTATLRNIVSADGVLMPETSWSFTTGTDPDTVVPTITAAGLTARANCSSDITLTWSPASDDVTPQAGISYQVFQSRFSGGQDLNAPSYATAAGITSYRVTGLDRGTTYYFTVRAVDSSTNRSVAFTERSATTSSYFGCPNTLAVAGGPKAVATADLNSDGELDLAIACLTANTVAILLGNGDGTFTPAVPPTVAVGASPVDVKVADFTHDGHLDLAVANRDGGSVSILLGNGDGTFGAAVNTALSGPLSLAVGEFENPANANLDLAVATGDDVSILSGNGDGTFSGTVTRLTVAGVSDARSVVAGDFDGDALVDVGVCYGGTDNAAVFLNSTPNGGALAFTAPTTATNRLFAVQNAPAALAAPDLDGDGRPDLALVNTGTPSVTVRHSSGMSANLFPPGTGSAGENVALPAGASPIAVSAGDVDGDGLPDLVTANRGPGTLSVLINLGGTSLFIVEHQDSGLQPAAVGLGDFNGDGKLDAAAANPGDNTVSILLNVR
ncbi:MAG: Ig-like domain-containing protein [Phycisphaerae bacterium]|nr:Ig-like domain-containing protein [Phycisphaerae bacterium]